MILSSDLDLSRLYEFQSKFLTDRSGKPNLIPEEVNLPSSISSNLLPNSRALLFKKPHGSFFSLSISPRIVGVTSKVRSSFSRSVFQSQSVNRLKYICTLVSNTNFMVLFPRTQYRTRLGPSFRL